MYGFNSRFSVLFHLSVCLIVHQYHAVLITASLEYILKSGSVKHPNLIFFVFIYLMDSFGNIVVHTNFEIVFPCFTKYAISILIWNVLNL
jgi:hypothetical protein